MKALFLGAGASYDCGLPLVTELTLLFKKNVMDLLNKYSHHSNSQINKIIEDTFKTGMHYEAIIGYAEVLMRHEDDLKKRDELYATILFFMQVIHYILLDNYQISQIRYSLNMLGAFKGLKHLITNNQPLWIFSLNHDLIIEMLANVLNIELKTGFFDAAPFVLNSHDTSNYILFENLTRENIRQNNFNFFNQNEPGINLLKLHGSLDIFSYNDGLIYKKVKHKQNNPRSGIEQLALIAETNRTLGKLDKKNITNVSTFLDAQGQMQFLKHSILSGAHKFSKIMEQVAPPEFLSQFDTNIKCIKELICIGYSFGDSHINEIIKNWLSLNDRHLIIVNPFGEIPSFLTHLTPRITIITKRASKYFMDISLEHGDQTISEIQPKIDFLNKVRDTFKINF